MLKKSDHFPQFGVLVTSAPPSGARPWVNRLERDAVASANVRRDDRCRRRESIRQHVKELPELRRPRGTETRGQILHGILRQARRQTVEEGVAEPASDRGLSRRRSGAYDQVIVAHTSHQAESILRSVLTVAIEDDVVRGTSIPERAAVRLPR